MLMPLVTAENLGRQSNKAAVGTIAHRKWQCKQLLLGVCQIVQATPIIVRGALSRTTTSTNYGYHLSHEHNNQQHHHYSKIKIT